jgi:hypothetical protein
MKHGARAFVILLLVGVATGVVQPLSGSSTPVQAGLKLEPEFPGILLSTDFARECRRFFAAEQCEAGPFLVYSCGTSTQMLFNFSDKSPVPVSSNLAALTSPNYLVPWDEISQEILALVGGMAGGYQFKKLKGLSAIAKAKVIARVVIAGLTAYPLGRVVGTTLRYRCSGADIQRFIRDKGNWPSMAHEFIGRSLREAISICEHRHRASGYQHVSGEPQHREVGASNSQRSETPDLDLHDHLFSPTGYIPERDPLFIDSLEQISSLPRIAGDPNFGFSVKDVRLIQEVKVVCALE